TDPDARVGHKTADSSFFGFKTHIAMSDERIITAAIVTTGEKSKDAGMTIDRIIGDTAYSEKDNIQYAKKEDFQLVSKLNPL
ncbi:IS5/IS1182 family transposase, partial [Metabacillus sp. DBTR6]|nr:IS5/IS1182 family transposase [Metabacillus rhizolycopersici]